MNVVVQVLAVIVVGLIGSSVVAYFHKRLELKHNEAKVADAATLDEVDFIVDRVVERLKGKERAR